MWRIVAVLPAVDVMATRIPVMDWSLNYGYCKAASEMTRRDMLEPITASPGDVLDIRYAVDGDMAGHDVYRYPDETSWNACDQAKATVVEINPFAGGGCRNASDFSCLRSTSGVDISVDAEAGDSMYLACSGMHCVGGLKLRVDVVEAGAAAARSNEPRDIVVPAWTDDFGFCDPPFDEVHRPHGLESIYAFEGDTLVFKYSVHHNVWVAPNADVASSCDFTPMSEIASTDAGGACSSDDSLGPFGSDPVNLLAGDDDARPWQEDCLRSVEGFRYPLSLDDSMGEALRDWPGGWVGEGSSGATESYARSAVTAGAVALHFVCQIHDHCVNGQRVTVYVLPRPAAASSRGASSSSFDDATELYTLIALLVMIVLLLVVVGVLARRVRALGSGERHVELRECDSVRTEHNAAQC